MLGSILLLAMSWEGDSCGQHPRPPSPSPLSCPLDSRWVWPVVRTDRSEIENWEVRIFNALVASQRLSPDPLNLHLPTYWGHCFGSDHIPLCTATAPTGWWSLSQAIALVVW